MRASQAGPAIGLHRPGAAARRPGGDRRARRGRLGRRRRLRRDDGGGAGARPRAPPRRRLGPASWVTLARATLAVGVAALVADSFAHDTPVALLVTLAAVALALDPVDGWVARRTGTATALGARFDGEVDAFLILALSVYVAPDVGAWVLAIGAARYLFLAGEWLLPWMRAPLPPRRWRKVVAAAQGIVLTVAAADVLPRALTQALLVAALAALARRSASACGGCGAAGTPRATRRPSDVGQRRARAAAHGHRRGAHGRSPCCSSGPPSSRRTSRASSRSARSRGCPSSSSSSSPWPCCCPPTPRRVLAVVAGAVLGVLVVVKVLDMGFFTAFDRPFDPVSDSSYMGIGIETLRDAIGRSSANLAVAAIVVLVVGLLAAPGPGAAARHARRGRPPRLGAPGRRGARRRLGGPARRSARRSPPRAPPPSPSDEVQAVQSGLQAHDDPRPRDPPRPLPRHARRPAADRPARQGRPARCSSRATGRVAVQGSSFSPGVDAVLDRGTAQLRAAGFSARSAFLTSSTFGGLSWLAHSTLQSGIRIGTQRRLRPARQEQPLHPQPGVQARRLAGGRRRPGEQADVAARARASTTTTRSTTAATSATAARASACPRCPTSTSCRPSSASSSPSATGLRCSPRSTSSPATRRGRASRGSSPGTTSATARSSTASRRRSPRRPRSSATPTGPAPPTASRSSTR